MSLYRILIESWSGRSPARPVGWTNCGGKEDAGEQSQAATATLEAGAVLFLPRLRFAIDPAESAVFAPSILGGGAGGGLGRAAKNARFDPQTERLGGVGLNGRQAEMLAALMGRFSRAARELIAELLPTYRGSLTTGRASFRPIEVAGRVTSWRKDDTRLHIDSFPATPTGGRRILRLFTNVNPEGRPRTWRIGGEFEAVARRFAGRLRRPVPGTGHLLAMLQITKTPRTPYDALMLQLHDAMKADDDFQRNSPQETIDFPAGSTWIAFTDQVPHAAIAGQYQLEQTFILPVPAMLEPGRSPLRVLEQLTARTLA